jgi:hypothetical protein
MLRLGKLLEATCPDTERLYALAHVPTIKEIFLLRYLDLLPAEAAAAAAAAGPGGRGAAGAAGGPLSPGAAADERPPELRRGDSALGLAFAPLARPPSSGAPGGAERAAPGGASAGGAGLDEAGLARRARELCEVLAPAARPAVSVWQVRLPALGRGRLFLGLGFWRVAASSQRGFESRAAGALECLALAAASRGGDIRARARIPIPTAPRASRMCAGSSTASFPTTPARRWRTHTSSRTPACPRPCAPPAARAGRPRGAGRARRWRTSCSGWGWSGTRTASSELYNLL